MYPSTLLPTVILLSSLLASCRADCYWRNGTKNPSSSYKPCSRDSSDPLSKICCADWDSCLPNGICKGVSNEESKDVYWRESCTESDWGAGGCQELCSNESSQIGTDIVVTPCDGSGSSTTWCCGDGADCCSPGSSNPRYTIAAIFGNAVPTPSASSSSSAPSASTQTRASTTESPSSTTSTAPPPASANSGLSTGAKAGIGVGAALGAIALIGLGIFVAKALHWKKKSSTSAVPATAEPYQAQPLMVDHYGQGPPGWVSPPGYYGKPAMAAPVPVYEAQGTSPTELSGNRNV
ncbi:hypothetical protein BDV95DRAFT_613096 [Massariosphaeria phaeospora]|uniref:Mid2 domain-containing protein n=1 Tax=Massariosphaeria phaeospora TaxID=100035 RepID=A0A7C8M6A3_9PLEO|nr:hypothetical protein BDV95DRAFT_613096 [Massariosphaeria phaeospora]